MQWSRAQLRKVFLSPGNCVILAHTSIAEMRFSKWTHFQGHPREAAHSIEKWT